MIDSAKDRFGLAGTVLDGKYRVDRFVAEGGFGVVYHGVHLRLDSPVAIKVLKVPEGLPAKAHTEFMQRFVLEAQTVAKLHHPYIVQVHDTGASQMPIGGTAPWIALEWLEGRTLDTILAERVGKPYSAREALTILRPAIEALATAHEESIAHRDIKPGNIMIVPGKRGATLRLLDFGIAKVMAEGESVGSGYTRTRSGLNAFSPQYAAPEQIGGARTGPWTDVHAMGLILTEMLIGRPAYSHDDPTELLANALNAHRPTPARFGVDVGPLERVIAKSLAFKPDERYHDCSQLLEALDEVVSPSGQATIPPALVSPPPTGGVAVPSPIVSRSESGAAPDPATGGTLLAPVPPPVAANARNLIVTPSVRPARDDAHAPGDEVPPTSVHPDDTSLPPPPTPTTLRRSATSLDVERSHDTRGGSRRVWLVSATLVAALAGTMAVLLMRSPARDDARPARRSIATDAATASAATAPSTAAPTAAPTAASTAASTAPSTAASTAPSTAASAPSTASPARPDAASAARTLPPLAPPAVPRVIASSTTSRPDASTDSARTNPRSASRAAARGSPAPRSDAGGVAPVVPRPVSRPDAAYRLERL